MKSIPAYHCVSARNKRVWMGWGWRRGREGVGLGRGVLEGGERVERTHLVKVQGDCVIRSYHAREGTRYIY